MYGTQKNRQAFNLVMVCLIASGCFWAVYAFTKVFSPSESGAASSVVPGSFDFSSPSSEAGPRVVLGSGFFPDPNDIPYWPSIDELQWFARTKRDGLFRKISQDDYEARRWVWYCDLSARATWPSDELVAKEVE